MTVSPLNNPDIVLDAIAFNVDAALESPCAT